ncbi:DHH family phosphoesterase [Halobaculum litoreum]|uniref:DHH family phosphoesterase n=1 Tax=Halobaculum litoreum TaxID=3031998 RepID=UPI0024C38631|nr:bifunctional oligoribonuclease/PAP phosphatase NrnA [Halobaculum sp. DT92]
MSPPERLYDLLTGGSEINIVCHNNPDPDCLASALALGRIAAAAGIDERHILYSGDISHQQNRAFVNLLDIDLKAFDADAIVDRAPGSLLAFVDHSIPGDNNDVPEGTHVDVVVDHHPAEGVEATFVDRREEIGATATIMTQYLRALDTEVDSVLATALSIAIRSETLAYLRGTTRAEYDAAGFLHDTVDQETLRRLVAPSVTGETLDTIATAIANRTVAHAVLVSHVGRTGERDALPQAADYLATLEGVETAIVFGIVHDAVHLSARSPDPRVHAGEVLRAAFDDVGSAGGHHDVAGGQIPLGIFADAADDDERLFGLVDDLVAARLFDALGIGDE